jgi:hypothetical protein
MNLENIDRRGFLKTCAFTTGVVGLSLEEKVLLAQETKAKESKPPSATIALPTGQIGKLKISRLICGGNLINGYAHARDMIYISELLKHDNMWCMDPDRTIEFMKTCEKPWIAYKVLAAGAIHPSDGFKYAFANGADFACVGMCDFQVREDAVIADEILTNLTRPRAWRG